MSGILCGVCVIISRIPLKQLSSVEKGFVGSIRIDYIAIAITIAYT